MLNSFLHESTQHDYILTKIKREPVDLVLLYFLYYLKDEDQSRVRYLLLTFEKIQDIDKPKNKATPETMM